MKMTLKSAWILGGTLLVVAACAAPERDYDAQQIMAVGNLEELMDVKATVADPRFKLAKSLKGKTPSAEQWAEFIDMGARLQITSRQGTNFSLGEGFDAYLSQLGDQAAQLEQAARDRKAERTLELVAAIKSTCSSCHKEYR